MSTLRDWSADPILRNLVADRIAAAYGPYRLRPDVGDVIADVLADVVRACRKQIADLDDCRKTDDCRAKAIVLGRLADWVEDQTVGAEDVAMPKDKHALGCPLWLSPEPIDVCTCQDDDKRVAS